MRPEAPRYSVNGHQFTTKPIDIAMPKNGDYCQYNKGFCQYNTIIVAFIVTGADGKMELAFKDPGSTSGSSVYSPAELKAFVNYMKSQGKHVLVSIGGAAFHIDWDKFDPVDVEKIIDEYGFDGLDLDFEQSAIPAPGAQAEMVAGKIMSIVNKYRDQGKSFWLTAAPEWGYVVPYAYGSGKWASHAFQNQGYIDLFHYIGMKNMTYIWPQTYNQGPSNGVLGYTKDSNGYYSKVTPMDGMDKFLAAMAWAASTDVGYNTNGKLANPDYNIQIPKSKLVLGIPAAAGAAGGNFAYVATPEQIQQSWVLMKQNDAVAAGFMNWSADFDATDIAKGVLSLRDMESGTRGRVDPGSLAL